MEMKDRISGEINLNLSCKFQYSYSRLQRFSLGVLECCSVVWQFYSRTGRHTEAEYCDKSVERRTLNAWDFYQNMMKFCVSLQLFSDEFIEIIVIVMS